MGKKIFSVLLIIIFGFGMFVVINNIKGETSTISEFTDESTGGGQDHLYHSQGIILEKDLDNNTLYVRVNTEEYDIFEVKELELDCSQFNIDILPLEIGDSVTFYYFLTDVRSNFVKVRDLVY